MFATYSQHSTSMRAAQLVAAAALLLPGALAAATPAVEYCQDRQVVQTTYVGQDKNVKVEKAACGDLAAPVAAHAIEARQINDVCGSSCKPARRI